MLSETLAVLVPERGGGCGDDGREIRTIKSRARSKPRRRAFLKDFFGGGVDDIIVEEVGKPHNTRPVRALDTRHNQATCPDVPDMITVRD